MGSSPTGPSTTFKLKDFSGKSFCFGMIKVMSKAQETAELYFRLSNKSDFEGIAKLLNDSTTYSSQNTGLYVGKEEIIKMQKTFHGAFSSLKWAVESVNEIKPGVVMFEYTFSATKPDGEKIKSSGLEYIVVNDDKILHIEVRNK